MYFILLLISISNQCEILSKIINYRLYDNEQLRINLSTIFKGNNLTYSTDSDLLYHPFTEIFDKQELMGVYYATSLKAFRIKNITFNMFAFLSQQQQLIEIFYTDQHFNTQTPIFNNSYSLIDTNIQCFDFDYISINSFILDCEDQVNNIFIIYDQLQITRILHPLTFSSIQKKIINFNFKLYQLLINHQSITVLYIYKWNNDYTALTLEEIIDSTLIGNLLNDSSFQLMINDFQVSEDETLYFLDQNIGLFKKQSNIIELLYQDIISFDIHLITQLFLFSEKILICNSYCTTIQLQKVISTSTTIYNSENYIILFEKGTFYLYDIFAKNLLEIIKPEGVVKYIVINDQLLTISNEYSHLYYFSQGFIQLNNINENINITIKAQDANYICTALVIIEKADKINYLYDTYFKLPSSMIIPSGKINIDSLVYGQNPNYQCLQNCIIEELIDLKLDIKYEFEITYLKLITISENKIYHIYQQNLMLIIQICFLDNEDDLIFECSNIQSLKFQKQLNNSNFQTFYDGSMLYLAYLNNSYTLDIININNGTQTISYSQLDNNQIISFSFHQVLCIVQDQLITIFTNYLDFSKNITISQSILEQKGYQLEWNPKQVFQSEKYFVIQNNNYLIISILQSNQLLIFKQFIIINNTDDIFVSIFLNSIIIIQNQIISQYNLNEEGYLMYNLTLSDIILNQNTQNVGQYVLLQNQQNQIIILQHYKQSLNLIKKIISQNENTINTRIISGTMLDNKQIIFNCYYLTCQYMQLYDQPKLILQLEYKQEQAILIQMLISNNYNQILKEQIITIIDSKVNISYFEKNLRDSNKLYLEKQLQSHQLKYQWYEGNVVYFTINSENNNSVSIINTIINTNNILLGYYNLYSITILKNQYILQSLDQFFIFNDITHTLIKRIILDIPQNVECIQTITNNIYYYTLCVNESNSYIHISKFVDKFPLGIQIEFEDKASKIDIIGNKYLIIIIQNILKVYTLINLIQINDYIVINGKFINYQSEIYPQDFEIINLSSYAFCLTILDSQGVLINLQGKYGVDYISFYDTKYIDLKQQKIQTLPNVNFIGVKVLHYYYNLILNIRYLIITNNSGSFGFRIVYDSPFRIENDFYLVPYGYWIVNNFQVDSNKIAIGYLYQKQLMIGIYQINYQIENMNFVQQCIIGGVLFHINQQNSFFYLKENKLFILNNNFDFEEHQINENITINIEGGLERQHIIITSFNNFYQQELDYIINYYFEQHNSNAWWIILLSVFGGAFLISLLFYFYKKTHPTKSVSDILLE